MTGLIRKKLRHTGTIVIMLTVMLALSFLIISQILGWQINTVYGAGMSPTFNKGDAVVIESVEPEAIAVDDIMVYYSPMDGQITTHRVIETVESEEGLFFRTKGDNNEDEDPYIVPSENVTGRTKYQIPMLGYFNYFTRTPLGVTLLVGMPGLIFTTTEINTLIRTLIPQEKRRRGARWTTGMKKKDWIR